MSNDQFFDGGLKKENTKCLSLNDESDFSDTDSIQSLPEFKDLENIVCGRYLIPKNIPKPEMLVCLHLTEFNELCMELDDKIEDINVPISKFEKRVKKIENHDKCSKDNDNIPSSSSSSSRASKRNRDKKKPISKPPKKITAAEEKKHDELLKELSGLLQNKSRVEAYYANILLKTIYSHSNPTKALVSIRNLLEHDKSTIHSLTLHLDHFSYIDSGLDDEDDDDTDSDEGSSSFSSSSF